jgi:glycosyltransferase involved in cell wall biosynthesis
VIEMQPTLVSTIIPVFNRPLMLQEAVASVLAQTYRPIEVIIVDDGSTDETSRVADDLATAHPDILRVVHQANRGVGAARETGRLAARGDLLQYLDSDDVILPSKFELQVAALSADPAASAAYGRGIYRDENGHRIDCTWKPLLAGETTILPHFLRARMWETPSPLYRASICSAAGPWSELRLEEDWEYDCRIGALGARLIFIDADVFEHRAHAPNRLSHGGHLPSRLRERTLAHTLIFRHARTAGITSDAPEMQHFARELFLLSRQCGAAGLADESRALFELSREASGRKGQRLQFRLYALLARLAGWRTMGRVSAVVDRFRS